MKRRLLLLVLIGMPFAVGRLASGCALQGVGERCSVLNNDADCQDGLTCTSQGVLGGNSDICCLPQGENTVPACIPGGLGEGGGDGGVSFGGGGTGGVGGSGGFGGMGGGTTTSSSTTTSSTTSSSSSSASSSGGGGGSEGSDAGSDGGDGG